MTNTTTIVIIWTTCLAGAAACNGAEQEIFITAKQDFFDMSIRPDLIQDDDRYAAMGFAGSGTFLTIKGRERIFLRPPPGYVFVTKQVCMDTKDVRHIYLIWTLQRKIKFTQKLFPRVRGEFDRLCFRPRKPEATKADQLKMMFRKTKAGDNYMSQQNILLQICVPEHQAVEEVLKQTLPDPLSNTV